jgi:hypothetical protein
MMNNEEFEKRFERKMEFLLNQQAKFDLNELKAAQANTDKAVARAADILSSLTSVMFEGFKITDGKIKELAESQKLTDKNCGTSLIWSIDKVANATMALEK